MTRLRYLQVNKTGPWIKKEKEKNTALKLNQYYRLVSQYQLLNLSLKHNFAILFLFLLPLNLIIVLFCVVTALLRFKHIYLAFFIVLVVQVLILFHT